MGRGARAAAAGVLALALTTVGAGCGGADRSRDSAGSDTDPSATPASTPSTDPYPARCGTLDDAAAQKVVAATRSDALVPMAAGNRLRVTTVGTGPVVVVWLHQTSGGACGWAPTMAAESGDQRFTHVLPDLCGSGDSECSGDFDDDVTEQAGSVVEWAAKTYHPRRLVVVGASMGGAIGVQLGADQARSAATIASMVNISGPNGFIDGQDFASQIKTARLPMLLVYDQHDDLMDWRLSRRLAHQHPERVRFLDVHGGHGWDNMVDENGRLTPAGRAILAFAAG